MDKMATLWALWGLKNGRCVWLANSFHLEKLQTLREMGNDNPFIEGIIEEFWIVNAILPENRRMKMDYEQMYDDLEYFEIRGYWRKGIAPEWAVEIATALEVPTGSINVTEMAWKTLARHLREAHHG